MYACRKLWFQQWYETAAAYSALKKGPKIPKWVDQFIHRDDVVKNVKPLIIPNAARKGCCLIVGEQGTGKTYLVQHILRNLKDPRGVVYIDFPQGETDKPASLAESMSMALNLKLAPDSCKHSFPDWHCPWLIVQ